MQCTTTLCRPYGSDGGPNIFNESASETFVPSGNRNSVIYFGAWFQGTLSNDIASLAGITAAQQEFLDATDVSAPSNICFYRFYDGVLGLAPFDPSNSSELTTYPSLFKSMVHDKLITHNVFTLELPQGPRFVENGRTPGSLRFGHPHLNSNAKNVITLPLSEESIPEQTWYVPGTDLDWDNGNIQARIGPNYPIQINPWSVAIRLPRPLASLINQQISLPDDENHVDCEGREKLPNLVLTFRGGSRLEITPEDYTLERFENGTVMDCVSLFMNTDEMPDIVVGAGVLDNYVTEWDLDKKEIRCKFDSSLQSNHLDFCC